MGKRIVSMLLALCLCITFLSACGSSDRPAETQTSSTGSVSGEQSASEAPDKTGPASTEPVFVKAVGTDEYYYYVYSTYVQINIYRGDGGDVVIPATLENLPVRIIGSDAFSGCINLTSVVIPDSVANIGSRAFDGCTNLTAVTIPDSVQEIGVDAFCDTPWLDSFSEEFVVVGDGVLIDYNGTKTEVTIPDTVKYISSAFYQNENIVRVSIPNSVINIEEYAFSRCSNLSEVTIPASVTSIGSGAFRGTILTDVTIPDSVQIIGELAFDTPWLYYLTDEFVIVGDGVLLDYNGTEPDVAIPDTVKYISSAFFQNNDIARVSIPDSVTDIGVWAFYDCRNLIEVVIPNSVTSIEASAFDGCTSLSEITIPNSVTSIGPSAFSKCTNLTEVVIPNSITSIEEWTFNECTNLSNVSIPDSVTYIGQRAFYDTNLAEITIPSSVALMVGAVFYDTYQILDSDGVPIQVANATYESRNNLTIICEAGSKAETYANENGIPCRTQ